MKGPFKSKCCGPTPAGELGHLSGGSLPRQGPWGRHPVLPGNLTVQQRDSSYKVPVTQGAPERLPGTTKSQAGLCLEEVSEQSNQDSIGESLLKPKKYAKHQTNMHHQTHLEQDIQTVRLVHIVGYVQQTGIHCQTGTHSQTNTQSDGHTLSGRHIVIWAHIVGEAHTFRTMHTVRQAQEVRQACKVRQVNIVRQVHARCKKKNEGAKGAVEIRKGSV